METNDLEKTKQEVWAILREVADANREFKEDMKDLKERFKETEKRFSQLDSWTAETKAQFKETDKRIKQAFDLFESQWGKLVESLVEGDIVRIFQERGLKVHDTSLRRRGNHKGRNFEFDIVVHNGDSIVVVEVKTTLRVSDVKHFLEKLRHAREWMDEYHSHTVYGAVAFLRAEGASDIFAENQSLFVIRATGNSAAITNAPDFKPKSF